MASKELKMPWMDGLMFLIFDKFLRSSLVHGHITLVLPDGSVRQYGDAHDTSTAVPAAPQWMGMPEKRCVITVHNAKAFFRIIVGHDIGLGEAFMAGDISVDDIGGLMAVLTANARHMEQSRGILGVLNWIGAKLMYAAHLMRANTLAGSKRNIKQHYDLGNSMYKLFLDPTLTYSSGIHQDGDTLETAQIRKLDALISGAGISFESHVLEIGCGWGSCGIRAVQQTGCRWTGITVSQEQLNEAQERARAAGVSDRVNFVFCDYRDVSTRFGQAAFDAVVSCEMIEAVGHEHLPTFFEVVGSCLKAGGLFSGQAITMPDSRYKEYCQSSDFIREHIFPGGHLPSMGAMTACASKACLSVISLRDIGPDYAITLRHWRQNWKENWQAIMKLGYPEEFMRKWEFYFAYCEAAFDCSYIHDYQIVWRRVESPTRTDDSGALESSALRGNTAPVHLSCAVKRKADDTAGKSINRDVQAPGHPSWQYLGSSRIGSFFGVYCMVAGILIGHTCFLLQ
jgi:cyclopropane fatty-acyl-phospholipid synthase-like methyltransferase